MTKETAVSTHCRDEGLNAAAPICESKRARAIEEATNTAIEKQPNHATIVDEVAPGSDQDSVVPLGASDSTRAEHGDASSSLLEGTLSSENPTDKPGSYRHRSIKEVVSNLVRCPVL